MNLFKNIASDHGYTQVGGNRAFPHAFGCQDEGSCHNLNDGHVSLRATRWQMHVVQWRGLLQVSPPRSPLMPSTLPSFSVRLGLLKPCFKPHVKQFHCQSQQFLLLLCWADGRPWETSHSQHHFASLCILTASWSKVEYAFSGQGIRETRPKSVAPTVDTTVTLGGGANGGCTEATRPLVSHAMLNRNTEVTLGVGRPWPHWWCRLMMIDVVCSNMGPNMGAFIRPYQSSMSDI